MLAAHPACLCDVGDHDDRYRGAEQARGREERRRTSELGVEYVK